MKSLAIVAAVVLAGGVRASAAITASEAARLAAAGEIVAGVRASIPQTTWDRARCVAVIPKSDRRSQPSEDQGVMSCRSGAGWTAPLFLKLGNRADARAAHRDILLLTLDERDVQQLLEGAIEMGARGEIRAYTRTDGRIDPIDLSHVALEPDLDANADVYGRGATLRSILAMREISAPTQAAFFLAALARTSSAPQAVVPAAATTVSPSRRAPAEPPAAAGGAAPSFDADVRARVTEIRQTLDRLLADASPVPTGTAGTADPTGGRTIAVDRARLLQLRQELDALIAALERGR